MSGERIGDVHLEVGGGVREGLEVGRSAGGVISDLLQDLASVAYLRPAVHVDWEFIDFSVVVEHDVPVFFRLLRAVGHVDV